MTIKHFNTSESDINQWNWAQERWAKFTGSLNHKLLGGERVKRQPFLEGGWTYIEQKAMETTVKMFERPELDDVKSLRWGKAFEEMAHEEYVRITRNTNVLHCGTFTPVFLKYDRLPDDVGVSPDGISITDSYDVDFGTEYKCPINPLIHFRRLAWKDQWDLKDNDPEYYCQVQNTLMVCPNAQYWHFVSFDERQINPKNRIKIIEVKPEKKYQDNLHMRLEIAIAEKKKIIEQYQNY